MTFLVVIHVQTQICMLKQLAEKKLNIYVRPRSASPYVDYVSGSAQYVEHIMHHPQSEKRNADWGEQAHAYSGGMCLCRTHT